MKAMQGVLLDDKLEDELLLAQAADLPAQGDSGKSAEIFQIVGVAKSAQTAAQEVKEPAQTAEQEGEQPAQTAAQEVKKPAQTAEQEGEQPAQAAYCEETAKKPHYLGSIKFFKNMILLVVVFAILAPSAMTVLLWQREQELIAQADSQTTAIVQLQAQYDTVLTEKEAQEQIWGGSVADRVVNAQELDYQTLYPDFYVKEPVGETLQDDGTVYLTFDDGPSSNTPLLLSILGAQDVKATFFVVGGGTEKQRQWMRDIVDGGHELAMHSYTHNYHTIYESVESFLDDYYELYTNIEEATGQAPTIFRFPGGSVNSYNYPVYREIIAEMLRRGFMFYDWNISSGDASGNYVSPQRITKNVLSNSTTYDRGIVLFHDAASKDSTVEALTGVIKGLREQGFKLAPLSREVRPILFNYSDFQSN